MHPGLIPFGAYYLVRLMLCCAAILGATAPIPAAAGQCDRRASYDVSEIANSVFFATREQTKFAPTEKHYPLASQATARYCFSRGCTGQLTVTWTQDEKQRLQSLRETLVKQENAQDELRFIKIAVLEMETWLYGRLRDLDPDTLNKVMRQISKHYGEARSENSDWITNVLSTSDRFNKECATYAMEATQHLLVLANLGLLKHWNVTAPVYRYGIPGHWTAGLENRDTCQRYRFDLMTRASLRHNIHVQGRDPAKLNLDARGDFRNLLPGMDNAGAGQPTNERRDVLLQGSQSLGASPPH